MYFDVDAQRIRSCSSKGVGQITLQNESIPDEEAITIYWTDYMKPIPASLPLSEIGIQYYISTVSSMVKIENKLFRLSANAMYRIDRAEGGEATVAIYVWTDHKGKIFKTDTRECR
jgi:hypothetical protein